MPGHGYFFSPPPSAQSEPSPLEPSTCPRGMDHQSWIHYRLGLQELSRRTEDSLRRAVQCFEATLSNCPDYIPAHIYLAETLVLLSHSGYQVFDPRTTLPKIRKHLGRAIRAQADSQTNAAALALSAKVSLLFSFDFKRAEIDFERASELHRTYPPAYHGIAHLRVVQGNVEGAFEAIQEAHKCDPLSPMLHATAGWLCYFTGAYEDGVERIRQTLKLHPHFPPGHVMLGLNLEALRRYDEAIHHYKVSLDLQLSSVPLACLGHACGRDGRRREAREYLKRLHKLKEERFVNGLFFALVHLGLGDLDQTVTLLEQAYEERADWLIQLGIDPRWRELDSNARFVRLLKKVGVHKYWKEASLKNRGRQKSAGAS